MGMNTDKIKVIVQGVNALRKGEGDSQELMVAMSRDMARSPKLAAAIIDKLRSEGIDLLEQDNEAGEVFRAKFKVELERMKPGELVQSARILDRLFPSG